MKNYYVRWVAVASTVLMSASAFAQEATPEAVKAPAINGAAAVAGAAALGGWIALGAGLAIAIAALGGAFAQGRAAAAALDGIARNPAAAGKLFLPLVLSLALIESLVIYGLLIAIFLNNQLTQLVKLFI